MFLLRKILEINIWRNNPDFPITAFMHPVFHIDVGWLYAAPGARNWSSLASVDGLWPSIFLLITFQRFPIGFRSGYRAGYDRVLIWWSSIHTLINLLCSMEHCPAEKKNPQILGTLSEQKEASFLPAQPCTWLELCALHKDKCASFQPFWSTPRSSPILHQISQWVRDTVACRPLHVSV